MKCKKIVMNLSENCYIYYNEKNECLIIDPGSESEEIKQFIAEKGLKPLFILLTHGHFDHIESLDIIRDEYNIPCLIHKNDANMLLDPSLNCSRIFLGHDITANPAENIINEETKWEMNDFLFEIIHTPGHSSGSVCYYNPKEKILFAGDTIFCNGVGRTDLVGSSSNDLKYSIIKKILTLPDDTVVFPGHGVNTTIGDERKSQVILF